MHPRRFARKVKPAAAQRMYNIKVEAKVNCALAKENNPHRSGFLSFVYISCQHEPRQYIAAAGDSIFSAAHASFKTRNILFADERNWIERGADFFHPTSADRGEPVSARVFITELADAWASSELCKNRYEYGPEILGSAPSSSQIVSMRENKNEPSLCYELFDLVFFLGGGSEIWWIDLSHPSSNGNSANTTWFCIVHSQYPIFYFFNSLQAYFIMHYFLYIPLYLNIIFLC